MDGETVDRTVSFEQLRFVFFRVLISFSVFRSVRLIKLARRLAVNFWACLNIMCRIVSNYSFAVGTALHRINNFQFSQSMVLTVSIYGVE